MYRDDYIMRMIRQLGAVLTYVIGLRQAGRYPMALIAIDNALRDRLGVGSDTIAERSDREILALIRFGEGEDSWRDMAAYIAALLYAEAEIYTAQGQPDAAAPRALRSLQLLIEASFDSPVPLPEFAPRHGELLRLLASYDLPARTHAALFQLCEQLGDFAEAENQLFALLEAAPADQERVAAGRAFYKRLLAHDDSALAAGNFSRDEAHAGLAELHGRS